MRVRRPSPVTHAHPSHIQHIHAATTTASSTNNLLQELIKETENLLEKWKHPDPYRPPTAPGGSPLPCSSAADAVMLTEH
jgi:hypothetical protein